MRKQASACFPSQNQRQTTSHRSILLVTYGTSRHAIQGMLMTRKKAEIPLEGRVCRDSHGMMVRVVSITKTFVAYQWLTGPRAGDHCSSPSRYFDRMFRIDPNNRPPSNRPKPFKRRRQCTVCGEMRVIHALGQCDRCYIALRRRKKLSAASSTTSSQARRPRSPSRPPSPGPVLSGSSGRARKAPR